MILRLTLVAQGWQWSTRNHETPRLKQICWYLVLAVQLAHPSMGESSQQVLGVMTHLWGRWKKIAPDSLNFIGKVIQDVLLCLTVFAQHTHIKQFLLLHVAVVTSFLLPYSKPLFVYNTVFPFYCWVISSLRLLSKTAALSVPLMSTGGYGHSFL